MPPTIVYRGNFQPDQAEPWSTESQIAATLETMGCRVIRVQEVGKEAVPWIECLETVERAEPDMFLWTTTSEIDPDAAYWSLDQMKASAIPTVGYHLDLWWGLSKRQGQLLEHPFFHALDYVFTADGGHQEKFHRIGVKHFWAEPAVWRKAAQSAPKTEGQWPVLFFGSLPYPHPEHAEARRAIIEWIRQQFPGKIRVVSGKRNWEFTQEVASATIILGDSCLAGAVPHYWSERVPETLSRAGCLVHPYCPGIEDSYTDGEHLRLFEANDLAQLAGIVDHLLKNPEVAAQIGANGQQHVLEHHCFDHRFEQLVFPTVGIKWEGCDKPENIIGPNVTPVLQGDGGFHGA
jgi:hypothetical protein